mmetsp:Transcript_8296/g.21201  ORF Transcript_8296/g.21201 Transcript_8296/m.21201 type:complete len:343 (+) Transcript_8296:89-1117(+)
MAEEYSRAVARVAAAQLAEAAGYEAVQESAVDMVAELAVRYLSELAAASHSYAELAGRTDTNAGDVLLAMEELGVSYDKLRQFLDTQEEIPFAHVLPRYPISAQPRHAPTFEEKGEAPPPHVPAFFPAFPDPHTYQSTAVFPARKQDKAAVRKKQAKGRQAAERALEALQQRAAPGAPISYTAAEPSRWGHIPGEGKGLADGDVNPFLAPPVWEEAPRDAELVPQQDPGHAALALGSTAAAFKAAAGAAAGQELAPIVTKKAKKGEGKDGTSGLTSVDWAAGLKHTAANLAVEPEGGTSGAAPGESGRDAAKDKVRARAAVILKQGPAAVLMDCDDREDGRK